MPNYFHYYYYYHHETIMYCRICLFIFKFHDLCIIRDASWGTYASIQYGLYAAARISSGGKRKKHKMSNYFHYYYYYYHETIMYCRICLFIFKFHDIFLIRDASWCMDVVHCTT